MFYIIPTIDVEGVHGSRPFDQMARGDIGDGKNEYGALEIARIFNNHGVSGTFFVDVFEGTLYGESVVGNLCRELIDLGQDVQLHTHPAWRDDPRDPPALRLLKREKSFFPQSQDFLYKCSIEEQIKILSWGANFLQKWTGAYPIAHRAGGYGANENTLRALSKIGIPIDSSMFVHPNCHLNLKKNAIEELHGVYEIPITGFQMTKHYRILNQKLMSRKLAFYRTGIDECTTSDLLWFCNQGEKSGLRFMNFFMHSYSLLKYTKNFTWFKPDKRKIHTINEFLEQVQASPDHEVTSIKKFYENNKKLFSKNNENNLFVSDSTPQREIDLSFKQPVMKKLERILKF